MRKILALTVFAVFIILLQPPVKTSADQAAAVRLPVLMYHNILDGKKSQYSVPPKTLEDDLVMLKSQGFTAVLPSQIIKFVYKGEPLPKKPILLSFDDGHYNNMHFALPLLEKHGFAAVFNIIGAFSEHSTNSGDHSNISYSHMTWQQVKKAQKSKFVEIGSHTYNMHNYKPRFGIAMLLSESPKMYADCLETDILLMQDKLKACGVPKPEVFAYPFGEYNDFAEKVLIKHGFKLMLTCNMGVSVIEKNKPQTLYRLKRINRDPSYSPNQLQNLITK